MASLIKNMFLKNTNKNLKTMHQSAARTSITPTMLNFSQDLIFSGCRSLAGSCSCRCECAESVMSPLALSVYTEGPHDTAGY